MQINNYAVAPAVNAIKFELLQKLNLGLSFVTVVPTLNLEMVMKAARPTDTSQPNAAKGSFPVLSGNRNINNSKPQVLPILHHNLCFQHLLQLALFQS